MKRILYRFLSLGLLIVSALWPTSCKRIVDLDAPKPHVTEGGKVIIRPNVFVLDSVYNDQLVELTNEYLLFKTVPTLRNGRLAGGFHVTTNLKPGDVVLGYPSTVAPNGFGAKVVSVSTQNQAIKVTYKAASLVDIFLSINKIFTIEWGKIERHPVFKFPVKQKVREGTIEVEKEISGTADVDIKYTISTQFELILEEGTWKKIRIESFLDMDRHKTAIEVEGGVTFTTKQNFICYNMTRRPVPLGELPIFFRPVARLDASVDLSATAKIKSEQKFSHVLSAGLLYDGTNWSTIRKDTEKVPDVSEKTGELVGKMEVGIEGSIVGYFYQFFPVDCKDDNELELSIGLSTKAYLGLEGICSSKEGIVVRSYVGAKGALGLKAKLFDLEASPNVSMGTEGDIAKVPFGSTLCPNDPNTTDTPVPNEVEEASTSVSTADPHMTTFDRGRYDFMAVGEFVAAKSTTDNFQVQVRQAPYPSSTQVSVNTGVAMQVDNDRVCVYPGPSRLYVNNQAVNLSFTEYPLNGGGSIQYANGNLSIKNRNGDRIEVKLLGNDLDYFITPAKNRSGKLAGLFGNYDGNPSNDLVQANGTRISNTYRELYPAFADSWRITQNQSLFVYETGKTTDSYTDKNFPRSEIQLTESQRAAAEQTCRQAGVTDPDALEGCIVDVALTGNQTFVERAKQNQIISNAKSILSASNFSQYRNEFTLSSDATVNGSTVLLNSKGTIGWNDAYLNRDGYETEIVLSVNAPTPCFPLFDINVMDNTATGDPNQNYLRLSANAGKTQVELVNSGNQPQQHPVNLFDGNRHRIRIATTKALSGSQTTVRILIYIDNYEPLTINRSYASSSLAGYLYPMLKNETINCSNGQITIFGWSFKSQ